MSSQSNAAGKPTSKRIAFYRKYNQIIEDLSVWLREGVLMEAWLKMMIMDAETGARLLGITDQQMAHCLTGSIPRHIALACSALYHRLDPGNNLRLVNELSRFSRGKRNWL
ncbi:hypothetical protein [Pararhizobium capsulatum]|uniref:hypothetical protein n=1 Tax=Pararhizobium capsulatum TaxID=34014 RepID=UPI0027D90B75|nr:hypothetical protein [Pararhizobium capsulatum]